MGAAGRPARTVSAKRVQFGLGPGATATKAAMEAGPLPSR